MGLPFAASEQGRPLASVLVNQQLSLFQLERDDESTSVTQAVAEQTNSNHKRAAHSGADDVTARSNGERSAKKIKKESDATPSAATVLERITT